MFININVTQKVQERKLEIQHHKSEPDLHLIGFRFGDLGFSPVRFADFVCLRSRKMKSKNFLISLVYLLRVPVIKIFLFGHIMLMNI